MLLADERRYEELNISGRQMLSEDRLGDRLPLAMGATGGRAVFPTAQHFLTYRSEGASAAEGLYWIGRIPRPVLMVRDEADSVVAPFEPQMLLAASKRDGHLTPSITYTKLSNSRPPSFAAHLFTDTSDALVNELDRWLKEIK
jgi:hypothetical protein